MKIKLILLIACFGMMTVLSSCGGECKDHSDLQSKVDAMNAADSIGKVNIAAYNGISDAWMKNSPADLDKYVDANIIDHNPDTMLSKKTGLEAWKEGLAIVAGANSDMGWKPAFLFADGDKVFAYGKMSGKNTGDMGPGMPATNKSYEVDFAEVIRFENGKAVERWGIMDMMTMMTQLGMMGGH